MSLNPTNLTVSGMTFDRGDPNSIKLLILNHVMNETNQITILPKRERSEAPPILIQQPTESPDNFQIVSQRIPLVQPAVTSGRLPYSPGRSLN